jgi:hypothetical protein
VPSLLDPDEDQTLAQTGAGLLRIGQSDSDQGAALADLYRRVSDYMDGPQANVTPRWDADNPIGTETTQTLRQATPIVSPERYQAHAQVQQAMELAPTIALGMLGDAPGIKAYHGSPYSFDAFDASKIGSGEGAQAYGHGLYFAGNEDVAQGYRDNITPQHVNFQGQTLPTDAAVDRLAGMASEARPSMTMPNSVSDLITDWIRHGQTSDQIVSRINAGAWPDELKADMRAVNDIAQQHMSKPTGHMYEVNIAADPAHFLDWDKPLSEQSQHVQDALAKTDWYPFAEEQLERKSLDNPTGHDLHRWLMEDFDPQEGSTMLRDAGIPGIRYLDAGSRAAGQGSHNHVVFDPATIEILRKYGIAGLGLGLGAAATQQGNGP